MYRKNPTLAANVTEYEKLLREEDQQRKTSIGTCFHEVNSKEVVIVDLLSTGSFICPLLMKKTHDLWKKSQASKTQLQYTIVMANTEEIFYFLLKEKFIKFSQDHQLLSKGELRGKMYCKYHNSWSHNINTSWSFRNIIQDTINKRILKFLEKRKSW